MDRKYSLYPLLTLLAIQNSLKTFYNIPQYFTTYFRKQVFFLHLLTLKNQPLAHLKNIIHCLVSVSIRYLFLGN